MSMISDEDRAQFGMETKRTFSVRSLCYLVTGIVTLIAGFHIMGPENAEFGTLVIAVGFLNLMAAGVVEES